MGLAVGVVIIGGLRRIAHTAEAIVPTMVLLYVAACLWIILGNIEQVPQALSTIFNEAFSPIAVAGGMVGALVQGFKRAMFSSEAGLGSAAIVHSTASVKYPIRQGMVALYEPFIDTIVICTMTALVIVITGVYNDPATLAIREASKGAALTSVAFATVSDWFPMILTVSVVLFAYSTMISWSYYGERCWTYLFGERGLDGLPRDVPDLHRDRLGGECRQHARFHRPAGAGHGLPQFSGAVSAERQGARPCWRTIRRS